MKKQVQVMVIATMTMVLMFSFDGYSQQLFSTIFNEEAGWDNPGGSWGGYNEKTYEEGDWFFHSTSAVRGTPAFDETFGGSAYSFRDRDVFSFYNTSPVSAMSGFSLQLRDWMTGSGVDRNLKMSTDGGESWETIFVINKDWFDAYQVYQEYIYYFPGGPQSFAAEEFMIELDGGTNDNAGRINIGQFVVLGEPSQVATPVFDPAGGLFFDDIEVSITTMTPEASIFYTLDGSEPTESDFLFTNPITVDENVTIKARAFKEGLDPSNVATAIYVIRILLLEKDFEDDDLFSGGWTVYDYFEGANSWEVKSFGGVKFAEIREFQSDPPFPHSWYISPAINLGEYENVLFSFESLTAFRTGDALSVYISEDYSGDGDPANASWTELPAEFDPHTGSGYGNWTPSGDIDLSEYTGSVYIGFEYESDDDNKGTWQITNILVTASDEAVLSNNAELETFTVGGINVLDLSGLEVDDPDTDPGAILLVEDFSDFFGIVVETQHAQAEAIVTINDIEIPEEDLEDQVIAYEDVILVTVTAEDQLTVKYYKLTVLGENRILVLLTPEAGDEFFTFDEIIFSWEAENIEELLFELYKLEIEEVVISEVVPADLGEIIETVPNGINGTYIYRLTDNDDPSFSEESGIFTITDNVEPGLLEQHPAPGAVNVPVSIELTMTFDEPVMPGEGSIHIYKVQGDELIESVAADSDLVVFDEEVVYINFTDNLEFETAYFILVDDDAIQDLWGNFYEGIVSPSDWTFTTREDALICNGDFEYWVDGLPECWYGIRSNISAANVVQYDDNPYSGSYAVQLINTGSSHRRFTSQVTTVEDEVAYVITFWVKGQGQIRTGLFDDRETGFGYAPYNDYIDVESDTWAEYSQIVTAANSSDIAEFIFSLRFTGEDYGHLQLDHVTVEEFEPEPPTEVDNLAELRNMPADGTVYHYTGNAVIVAMDDFRNRKFIQDETAAILIDDLPGIIETEYELYDVITGITGKLSIFLNMVRFQPEENTAPATENTPVEPYLLGLDEVTADDQAKLIQFENVVFLDLDEDQVFENGFNYIISDGEEEFIVRTDFWDVDYMGEFIPQTPLNISGVVIQHQETLQLVPRFMTDFEDYEEPGFTVIFSVTDDDGNPIDDAIITLGDFINEPGDYVFTELEEGEYAWTVSRLCYQDTTGSMFVQEDAEIEVVMQLDILPGDANGDGAVNVLDIIAIASYYAGSPPDNFCPYNADVNADGFINILDVISTVNIFMDNKMVPYPGMNSEAAHIYLYKDGITLESDGTLAGIQFELSGDHAGLGLDLQLPGHELVYAHVDGMLKAIIFSIDNKGIPAGTVRLVDFDREANLSWSGVLAGNLNAEKVPVNAHEGMITSVTTTQQPQFKVYPNPASDMVWVEFLAADGEVSLSLLDVNGRVIKNRLVSDHDAGQASISLGDLKPGVYLLSITIDGKQYLERIIVK